MIGHNKQDETDAAPGCHEVRASEGGSGKPATESEGRRGDGDCRRASPVPISWGQGGSHCVGPTGVSPKVGLWTGSLGMVCGHRQCRVFVLTC